MLMRVLAENEGTVTIDQPSGVTYEYEICVNSLITQPHGIFAINEILFKWSNRSVVAGFSFDVL